jgi:hypothetical protein
MFVYCLARGADDVTGPEGLAAQEPTDFEVVVDGAEAGCWRSRHRHQQPHLTRPPGPTRLGSGQRKLMFPLGPHGTQVCAREQPRRR